MTLSDRRWYRVNRGGADSESIVEALAQATSLLSTEVFSIRNPELRVLGRPEMANMHYDGRAVRGRDTLRLICCLLDDPGFWCELESSYLDVHVAEDAVYLGFSRDRSSAMKTPGHFQVTAVAGSPYDQEGMEAVGYRPVAAEFWGDLDALLRRHGRLLLLRQWAAGLGGEEWYHLQDATDIAVTRNNIVPRSVLAVFGPASYVEIDGSSDGEVRRFAGPDPLFGNFRWLVPIAPPKLQMSMVSDEMDLLEMSKSSMQGAILFCWPEENEAELVVAACPDEDGVVRTQFRFS